MLRRVAVLFIIGVGRVTLKTRNNKRKTKEKRKEIVRWITWIMLLSVRC